VYPFWAALARHAWMQKVLVSFVNLFISFSEKVGVNAGALGLILSAFLLLWAKIPLMFNSCAVLAYLLSGFFDINTPLVIVLSGLLGLCINLIF
jgi:hypothetical protein